MRKGKRIFPEVLYNFEELRRNARLNKHQHFSAADRAYYNYIALGVPVVIINVFIGSLLFISISGQVSNFSIWLGGFLSFIAVVCTTLQTFFNPERRYEGHRQLANRYLDVQRASEYQKSTYIDGVICEDKLARNYKELLSQYRDVNNDAENYHTSKRDYKYALEYDKQKCKEENSKFIKHRLENSINKYLEDNR